MFPEIWSLDGLPAARPELHQPILTYFGSIRFMAKMVRSVADGFSVALSANDLAGVLHDYGYFKGG
jgi:hypothetical protein